MGTSSTRIDPNEQNAIGVLGGLGPYAGIDLVRAIFDETIATTDQEHLPVALLSYPSRIPDRSAWIESPETAPSPVPGMLEVLRRLDDSGCSAVGIPCNTAHVPVILGALTDGLSADGRSLRIIHIVDAVVSQIAELAPAANRIGVLATTSSVHNRLHQIGLQAAGFESLRPSEADQALVQASIFDSEWGLKARSNPPSERARAVLLSAADRLIADGADAVILGCTELPLAVPEPNRAGIPFINSTLALARALIRATHPSKLRPATSE